MKLNILLPISSCSETLSIGVVHGILPTDGTTVAGEFSTLIGSNSDYCAALLSDVLCLNT